MSDVIEDAFSEDLNDDLEMFDFHELTPEEIEENKRKRAVELAEKGFLPENEGYSETMNSPQEIVEGNPEQFIIQECLPACKELWSKNIYTFMVSDHLNEGGCWIEIILDALSEENKDIYMNMSEDEAIKFSYHPGAINFGVNCVGVVGQQKLLELAKKFKMQDVPQVQAYLSPQDFLMKYCGCYEEYKNPDYEYMTPPWEADSIDLDAMEKYDEWEHSIKSKETLRRFNSDKVTKSLQEYAQGHGMIVDEDRVHLSDFHYKKHQNYLAYLNQLGIVDGLKK